MSSQLLWHFTDWSCITSKSVIRFPTPHSSVLRNPSFKMDVGEGIRDPFHQMDAWIHSAGED